MKELRDLTDLTATRRAGWIHRRRGCRRIDCAVSAERINCHPGRPLPSSASLTPRRTTGTLAHSPHYTLYTTQPCILHTKQPYTLHTTQPYTLHTLHSARYTLHTTHYTLHTTHYTLHTTHYTLHTTHYTLHTTHYTVRIDCHPGH